MQLTQDDADTILRIKAATMRANGYTGAVAISIKKLYQLNFKKCCEVVDEAIVLAKYESRFGK